jgi:hypothetical protein
MSMTGINYFSAMMITSEIGNIARLSISQNCIVGWHMSINTSIWKFVVWEE